MAGRAERLVADPRRQRVVVDLQTGKRFETSAAIVAATSAGSGRVVLMAISASGNFEAMLAREKR